MAVIATEEDRRFRQALSIREKWGAAGHLAVDHPVHRRSFTGAAAVNRLTGDWHGQWMTLDALARLDLARLRARSRELERFDPYAQGFGHACVNNVLGSEGMHFQMQVEDVSYVGAKETRTPDLFANRVIELARKKFEKKRNYTVTGTQSRIEAHRLILWRTIFDGEIFVRKVAGYDNEFAFSFQLIPADYCDHLLNAKLANGEEIRMGIGRDAYKRRVAYYFLAERPGDWYAAGETWGSKHIRVDAREIVHVYRAFDPDQTRGLPWMLAAMLKLHHLGKFEEAAVINARVTASKVGFYSKETPEGWMGNKTEDDGGYLEDVQPGTWTELPMGVTPVPVNPQFPDAETGPFTKAMLRGVAACQGISYMTFSADVSDANYSSLVAGKREEQEQWKTLQTWFEEAFCDDDFEAWLPKAIMAGQIPLPMSKLEKFNAPVWTGRRWQWHNPAQEVAAKVEAINNRLTSRSQVIEEMGGDPEKVFAQIAQDEELLETLEIPAVVSAAAATPPADVQTQDSSGDAAPVTQKAIDIAAAHIRAALRGGPGSGPHPGSGKDKSAIAKAAHVMVDKNIQRYAEEHNEPKIAKALGGESLKDNEPVDIVLRNAEGKIQADDT